MEGGAASRGGAGSGADLGAGRGTPGAFVGSEGPVLAPGGAVRVPEALARASHSGPLAWGGSGGGGRTTGAEACVGTRCEDGPLGGAGGGEPGGPPGGVLGVGLGGTRGADRAVRGPETGDTGSPAGGGAPEATPGSPDPGLGAEGGGFIVEGAGAATEGAGLAPGTEEDLAGTDGEDTEEGAGGEGGEGGAPGRLTGAAPAGSLGLIAGAVGTREGS